MTNPNEHIEDFLKYYFELKKSPNYAVLLKGKWGIGKTWFLKEVMKSLYNPDYQVKTHLYVSLYGITSFEEIENEFFRQLHPVLSSKGMILAGKIGKGLLKTALKIDLNGDGKTDATMSSQVPDINLPDYLSNKEGLILVFDDLERASMDLESLLGYINYFVEHQGYKVIIIANEEELINKEDKKEASYKRIKEKLIGKTFEIQPRLELAIDNFIEEMEDIAIKKFFNTNLDLIKDCYQRSNYWNLRHLRQALMDFARLIELLSDGIRAKEGIIEELLSIYLILSFEIKSGEMLSIDINKIEDLYFSDLTNNQSGREKETENFYLKIKEKYPMFDPLNMLLEKSTWVDIFDKGLIDIPKVEESLKNSRYFYNENQSEWMQLWHFMSLKDSNFHHILSIVKNQFNNKEYEELGEIKHVTGLFLELVDLGLLNMSKKKILEIGKKNIDNLIIQGKEIPYFDYVEIYDDTSTFGLEFYSKNDSNFIKLLIYITEVSRKQLLDSLPKIANELFQDMKSNVDSFYKKLYYSGVMDIYQNEPVLNFINSNEFVNTFIKIEPSEMRRIALVILSRYKNTTNIEYLLIEVDWLKQVVKLLEDKVAQRSGEISAVQIKYLIDNYLIPAIKILEKTSN